MCWWEVSAGGEAPVAYGESGGGVVIADTGYDDEAPEVPVAVVAYLCEEGVEGSVVDSVVVSADAAGDAAGE